MKYKDLYKKGVEILKGEDVENAEWDARLLLEHVCRTDRNYLLSHGDNIVSEKDEKIFLELISKRALHIPLQHLTGVQNFMGLDFKINKNVLIPRADTEILVEEVLRKVHDGMSILDMCTGSGCIIISLMKYTNYCRGIGSDVSEDALLTARENADIILGTDHEDLKFVSGDLFENIDGKFDIIVSNPPYIKSEVIPTLSREVRDFDPHSALDGGEDGLYFYKKIIVESVGHLIGGGMLFFEIGFDQADEVYALMESAGFMEINIVKDYAGLDRVVYGEYRMNTV